ncbi:hypothetical protein PR003_g7428 [Phytophthora rubi]|uniref:Secreted protein n=1 Tax=Phytophthora rubi TaxID=129364 RepID=A0A6A4FLV0_9STRA|nr:hypothetical protein PR002_g7335 [Phytophthora rubi]KAE9346424.1 hypothetical protein PR003_g7428 [Phytophthora rubi]
MMSTACLLSTACMLPHDCLFSPPAWCSSTSCPSTACYPSAVRRRLADRLPFVRLLLAGVRRSG